MWNLGKQKYCTSGWWQVDTSFDLVVLNPCWEPSLLRPFGVLSLWSKIQMPNTFLISPWSCQMLFDFWCQQKRINGALFSRSTLATPGKVWQRSSCWAWMDALCTVKGSKATKPCVQHLSCLCCACLSWAHRHSMSLATTRLPLKRCWLVIVIAYKEDFNHLKKWPPDIASMSVRNEQTLDEGNNHCSYEQSFNHSIIDALTGEQHLDSSTILYKRVSSLKSQVLTLTTVYRCWLHMAVWCSWQGAEKRRRVSCCSNSCCQYGVCCLLFACHLQMLAVWCCSQRQLCKSPDKLCLANKLYHLSSVICFSLSHMTMFTPVCVVLVPTHTYHKPGCESMNWQIGNTQTLPELGANVVVDLWMTCGCFKLKSARMFASFGTQGYHCWNACPRRSTCPCVHG